MRDDYFLLRQYDTEGSEAAFRELVQRHLPLVYSAALRHVGWDHQLAEDVTQRAFTELARAADRLSSGIDVAGWLCRTTRFIAAKTVRGERRRKNREGLLALEQENRIESPGGEAVALELEALCRLLEDALRQLENSDREALVLRFYHCQDFRTIGSAFRVSEDTAQKRVSRALKTLRTTLRERGASLSLVALAGLLANQASAGPSQGAAAAHALPRADGGSWLSRSGSARIGGPRIASAAGVLLLGVIFAVGWSTGHHKTAPLVPSELVAWWAADGDSTDKSGGHHARIEGGVSYAPGVVGRAFAFDGQEGTWLRVPNAPDLNLTNQITLELWFRPDGDSLMGHLVSKRSENTNETQTGNLVNYGLHLNRIDEAMQLGIFQMFNDPETQGGLFSRKQSGLARMVPPWLLPWLGLSPHEWHSSLWEWSCFNPSPGRDLSELRGQWHHLAGTYQQESAGRVRLMTYFDGVLRQDLVVRGVLAHSVTNSEVLIGGFPTVCFKGRIDEVRLYKRALTPGELHRIHAEGRARLKCAEP